MKNIRNLEAQNNSLEKMLQKAVSLQVTKETQTEEATPRSNEDADKKQADRFSSSMSREIIELESNNAVSLAAVHKIDQDYKITLFLDETERDTACTAKTRHQVEASVDFTLMSSISVTMRTGLLKDLRTLKVAQVVKILKEKFVDHSSARKEELHAVAKKMKMTTDHTISNDVTKYRILRQYMRNEGWEEMTNDKNEKATIQFVLVVGLGENDAWAKFFRMWDMLPPDLQYIHIEDLKRIMNNNLRHHRYHADERSSHRFCWNFLKNKNNTYSRNSTDHGRNQNKDDTDGSGNGDRQGKGNNHHRPESNRRRNDSDRGIPSKRNNSQESSTYKHIAQLKE